MYKNFLIFISTGCYTGFLKPFPGTWGTIPAWLIAFFFIKDDLFLLSIVTVVTFFISVWAAGKAEDYFGHDARKIVIDEWAGMFVALLFVPYSLVNYGIAFVSFRAFDVIKIPPARQLEKLPGGWGVTMDDIVAGIHANLFTQLVIYLMKLYS